jgi:hypothetical protein
MPGWWLEWLRKVAQFIGLVIAGPAFTTSVVTVSNGELLAVKSNPEE